MKFKICSKCKKEKPLTDFTLRKNRKCGVQSWCKQCILSGIEKYYKKSPWKRTFQRIKARCNNPKATQYKDWGGRGIKCEITEDQVKFLWFRDNAYLMKKPSIDRKNNNKNYTLENCRFMELGKNSAKDKEKAVDQYDLGGNFIKSWKSMMEVERMLGFNQANISTCCLGKYKQAYGYNWKFNIKKG